MKQETRDVFKIELRPVPKIEFGTGPNLKMGTGLSLKMKTSLGFTLVEMMIAVTILAIGIVLVLRSLLGGVSVIDSIQNRIAAVCFLESKMNILEETAIEEEGIAAGSSEETAAVGNRKAVFRSEVEAVEMEEAKEGQPVILKADLRISWQEGASSKDATLVTYFSVAEE